MFSPTRTALFLAIGALSFAADEAAAAVCRNAPAQCVTTGGVRSCYCPAGSEIGSVTIDTFVIDGAESGGGGDFAATWEVFNYGPGDGDTCPVDDFQRIGGRAPGRDVCGPVGTTLPPAAPMNIPTPCPFASSSSDGGVYGVNSVTISGGSVGGFSSDSATPIVCSQQKITLAGANTFVFGGVEAPAPQSNSVKTTGGAAFTGDFTPNSTWPALPVAACPDSHVGPAPAFTGSGGKLVGGALTVPTGATATLDPTVTYCFSSVTLGSGGVLAIKDGPNPTDNATIYVSGNFASGGGKFATGGANLMINSAGTIVSFTGSGGGDHLIVYAPNANVSFNGDGAFSGAFTGKTVNIGGTATINNNNASEANCGDTYCSPTVVADCDANPSACTIVGEVTVTPGQTCSNGGALLDSTAFTFIGHAHVETCPSGGGGPPSSCDSGVATDIYQLCTTSGTTYDCHIELFPVGDFGTVDGVFGPVCFTTD
jgi:hypothetical protein